MLTLVDVSSCFLLYCIHSIWIMADKGEIYETATMVIYHKVFHLKDILRKINGQKTNDDSFILRNNECFRRINGWKRGNLCNPNHGNPSQCGCDSEYWFISMRLFACLKPYHLDSFIPAEHTLSYSCKSYMDNFFGILRGIDKALSYKKYWINVWLLV